MLEKFLNIFRIPDLRKRVLFTLAMLAVYRLGGNLCVHAYFIRDRGFRSGEKTFGGKHRFVATVQKMRHERQACRHGGSLEIGLART